MISFLLNFPDKFACLGGMHSINSYISKIFQLLTFLFVGISHDLRYTIFNIFICIIVSQALYQIINSVINFVLRHTHPHLLQALFWCTNISEISELLGACDQDDRRIEGNCVVIASSRFEMVISLFCILCLGIQGGIEDCYIFLFRRLSLCTTSCSKYIAVTINAF